MTTTETGTVFCGNEDHETPELAAVRMTWPDGRFRPSADCLACMNQAIELYVLDDEADGRRHPVLVEMVGAESVSGELAKLRDACRLMGRCISGQARAMEAARIEMLQGGPDSAGAAMEWILNSLPDQDDNPPEDQWDGTETAQEWFNRTDERASGAAPAPVPAAPEIPGQMPLPGVTL